MPATQIKNDGDIPTQIIAESIVAISEGMKRIRAGRLNDKALILLIQHAAEGNMTQRDVKAVLDAMESLAATYLKPVKR